MAQSFGATPLAGLHARSIVWAALPEILAGIRLGVIRAVKGVVIGQLLVSIVGFGELFELYSSRFLMEHFWALLLVLFAFAFPQRRSRLARAPGRVLRRQPRLSHSSHHERKSRTMNYRHSPRPPSPRCPSRGIETPLFPVHRIYCVGRNYAAHAIEMGGDPNREPPFFFQKNPDNLVLGGGDFPYPPATNDVHHEIELVVALGEGRRGHPGRQGARLRLRLCGRPRHDAARPAGRGKKTGRPWEVGKAFEHSAPCGEHRAGERDRPSRRRARSGSRSTARCAQKGDLNQMIWKVPEMISYLSGLFRLTPGDLIMTGTPAGVGAVKRGDVLHGHVDGVGDLRVKVV